MFIENKIFCDSSGSYIYGQCFGFVWSDHYSRISLPNTRIRMLLARDHPIALRKQDRLIIM